MAKKLKGLAGYEKTAKVFLTQNMTVISLKCNEYINSVVRPTLLRMLTRIAKGMVDIIDSGFSPMPPYQPGGNADFPVWKGHLHDATGVAIYDNGYVYKFLPTKKAIGTQKTESINGIIGYEWLGRAISEANTMCSSGLWIVLFSSVPYAAQVNSFGSPSDRGMFYFDRLSDKELADIIFNLEMNPLFEIQKK